MSNTPSPADLAREFGISGMRVRGYLRERYPREAPGRGGLWILTPEQVADVRAYFGGRRSIRSSRSAGGQAGSAPTAKGPYQAAWYWEGSVQKAMARHLRSTGWTIVSMADTGRKERGDDIRATREGVVLVVEVKGFPSTAYADPSRAAEVKRTNPTVQAKHWLAEAIFRSLRTLGAEPNTRVAIALPDFPRYRTLLDEVAEPLTRLGIGVLFVSEDGSVATPAGGLKPGAEPRPMGTSPSSRGYFRLGDAQRPGKGSD